MRRLEFMAVILTVFLFSSCDPCNEPECIVGNNTGQFRIVSAADGRDLVFGPARVYDKNLIKFYSLKGTDTTYLDYQPLPPSTPGADSILAVRILSNADIAYMRLSNGDVDTFNISYNTRTTKCCGTFSEIRNFRFNNTVDLPGSMGIQVIRK